MSFFSQIQQPMILTPICLRGSFSNLNLLRFPLKQQRSPIFIPVSYAVNHHKYFSKSVSKPQLAYQVYDETPHQQNGRISNVTDLLYLMDQRDIRPNSQTYLWLLDSCFSSGSLVEYQKLHGRILKEGFDRESLVCDKLIDICFAVGDLNGVIKVFEDMPERSMHTWNKILSGFSARKMSKRVTELISQMFGDAVNPTEVTFAGALRACNNDIVDFRCAEQIHGKIFCHGLGSNPIALNPLIDLYAKKGFVTSAKRVFDNLDWKDSVSWVAMISGLSQNGCEVEAVHIFSDMHLQGTLLTPYVFSSVLSACTKIELFDTGMQLHALILKQGFSLETYVCNALVTLYSRLGKFISAEQVFSQLQQKDGVSYNSLISGLAQQGFSDRALDLFEKMQLEGLDPDCVTVASVLSACASTGAFVMGKQLHSYALKAGMSADIIIEGALLDLYVKCSDMKTAQEFFFTTENDNVVLWNVMLVAYGQLDDLSQSFRLFTEMQVKGLIPNQFTYPSILRTCTSLGALDLGEQIHTLAVKTGFQFNVYVCSVLIDMYAKHGKLDTALAILRRLGGEDVVAWTAMISGCTQHDLFDDAIKLFQEMLSRGIQADNIGFSSAISACSGIQALNQGQQVQAQTYVSGYSGDLSICNALVSLYARCGKAREAYLVFDNMNTKDNISWNGLISGFAQSGHLDEALKVFSHMNKAEVEPSVFTFTSAVSAAGNLADIKQGKHIQAMIFKRGFDLEIEISNALITMYAKCGSIGDSKRKFLEMPEKNDISWNAMITAYSQHGDGLEAVKHFENMKQTGVLPNYVTFVGVLTACSHVGLVNEGLCYFESMTKEYGLVPKPEHYACVVDLLCRAGLLSRAKKFVEEMPIRPDAMVWRTLLSACVVHKDVELGEFAAQHLLDLEPGDSATYVLLSNMYAVSRKWNYRDRTRQMMKNRRVKKEPGRSWVEVKNKNHAFFVGDRLHPLADKIYEYLDKLNDRAAEIGYVQDHNSLLNETELDQKDPSQYVHSEKLAITFALLSLPEGLPIRVMKNLRVCNDCHNWIKFVSRISNREIVVRDAYRFHHFEEGTCSCNDFW
ncbi:Pentatricopeptide repeat-containing protein At4g13650 [Linum grandiflorum]